jgi:hypothetical protein
MAKKIRSFWRLLLGSLITLLGFAACKSAKKMQKGDDTTVLYGPPPGVIIDKVVELYAPRPEVIEKKEPIDRMRLLYGVPPVKVKKDSK